MVEHRAVCEVDCFAALAKTGWGSQRRDGVRKDAPLSLRGAKRRGSLLKLVSARPLGRGSLLDCCEYAECATQSMHYMRVFKSRCNIG